MKWRGCRNLKCGLQPTQGLRFVVSGNLFPLHKLPEIRSMPAVPIFCRRFLCSVLLEIGPARIGSIFRIPCQAHRLSEIEPMAAGLISRRIFPWYRASKIGPLSNGPIFSWQNATNFR
jgi:hypothetical protein